MYALGIDSGTQGTKALIIDFKSAEVVARAYTPHAMIPGLPPGHSEQKPAEWLKALEISIVTAIRYAGIDPGKIVCLGISGQQHGFVGLDSRGVPVRPAKLWNDTSTIAETEEIISSLGGKTEFIKKLGINLAVGFTASKILWLKKHEPEKFHRLKTILLPHNYLNYFLTGKLSMEFGDASGTGLMDIRHRRWSEAAAAAIDSGLMSKLPNLSHPSEPVGYIKKSVAERFGFKRVLVSSGGGDNMMGAIGTGNVASGVCTLSLGTSGTIYSFSDRPFVDPEGEIAAFCDSTGGWLPLLCTMNVTNTTEIVKSIFDLNNKELEAASSRVSAGAEGLIFLPFVDGERVPVLPSASAVFFGLNRRNFDRKHIIRAVLEGTILNLGYGFGRMKKLGLKPSEIRVTGGGARNRLWLKIAANILNTPAVTLKEKEAAAFGAALQAIWNWHIERGESVSIQEVIYSRVQLEKDPVYPEKETAEIYAEVQKNFNSLWKRLVPEFKKRRRF